jgi:predicted transcriptional regulator
MKNLKSKEMSKKPLSGQQVVAEILGYSFEWVSKVLKGTRKGSDDIKQEYENYKNYQDLYIKKRKIILGINKK